MGYRNPLTVLGRGLVIVGAVFKTAYSGARWEIGSTPTDSIIGYSGNAAETTPASLKVSTGSGSAYAELDLTSGSLNGHAASSITLRSRDAANTSTFGLGALAGINTDLLEVVTTQGIALFGAGRLLPSLDFTSFAAQGMYNANFSDWGAGRAIGGYWINAEGWVRLQGFVKATNLAGVGTSIVNGLPWPKDGAIHTFALNGSSGTTILDINAIGNTGILTGASIAAGGWVPLDGITYQTT